MSARSRASAAVAGPIVQTIFVRGGPISSLSGIATQLAGLLG
jgi:hypothetical protein